MQHYSASVAYLQFSHVLAILHVFALLLFGGYYHVCTDFPIIIELQNFTQRPGP